MFAQTLDFTPPSVHRYHFHHLHGAAQNDTQNTPCQNNANAALPLLQPHFKDDLPTIRFSPGQICMREQKNKTLKSVSNVIPFNLGEDAPVAMGNNGQGFSEISMGVWDYRTLHC
ncbi:hypothetical protein ACFX2I_003142 [Malus domestica]